MSHQGFPWGKNSSSDESESIQRKPINIVVQTATLSVALLVDGQRFLSGDKNGKIRCWQIEDGEEVGTPMNVDSAVRCLATSQDGRWIVAGTESGQVVVWAAGTGQIVKTFTFEKRLNSVDVSLDGSKIAIAADEKVVSVYPLLDGKKLYGWRDWDLHLVKFSPDGFLLAIGAEVGGSSFLTIYDSWGGKFLGTCRTPTRSVTWAGDSKQLFALSSDGNIHCVDASNGKTLSQWPVHSNNNPTCISLTSNGTFIAASANSSVSFWDTSTHEQIGFVIHYPSPVNCMAISSNSDLLIGGSSGITVWDLRSVFSAPYIDHQAANPFKRTPSHLKATIDELRIQLAISQRAAKQEEEGLQNAFKSQHAEHVVPDTKTKELEKTVEDLRTKLANSQQRAEGILLALRQEQGMSFVEIKNLESTIQQLRTRLSDSQQSATQLANSKLVIRAHQLKHECEALYAKGHMIDAAKSLLDITRSMNDDVKSDTIIMNWLPGFTNKCVAALERTGNEASQTRKDDEALAAYAAALSLRPSSPSPFLRRWVSIMLPRGSINEILDGAHELKLSKLDIYCAICDILEGNGRVKEAIKCFQEMQNELTQATDVGNERVQWEFDFRRRCTERLEKLADFALSSQKYHEADEHYSITLSLDPLTLVNVLIKRSKARVMMKRWKDALEDADEVIKLDPSSHLGYEQRHAALIGLKRHEEAVTVYDTMLSKLKESPDIHIRELRSRYAEVITAIRRIIHATISHLPRILIDTTTGRLNDRVRQVKAFEALPIFNELVSSMTDEVDYAWIWREVKDFYQYVMLSHRWEYDEPLFREVERITVYKLEESRGNIKLRTFCSLVRSLGFRWAWSDTCCIDKENNVVLQESLVAMFTWYRGSSLTIIHLLGVSSLSEEPEGVKRSIWNTRVWTYQEYVAAQRVLFYTEDWKPYFGLTLENHKESPVILKEMEMLQVSSEQVAILQPGLDRVREKLYLASTRETTLVEDIAYSLLGILNASIPAIYGEGTRAVGRLLEYVLTGSGDATILAWTGTANDYNSCLPVNLAVYKTVVPPHIPQMETTELDRTVAELRSSLPDVSLAAALYDELNKLPSPTVASSRLRLPGIVSPITDISTSELDPQTYRATTSLFGDVKIKTTSNVATMKGLCLVHPWIRPLLDQEFMRGSIGLDVMTQALRLIARLQQPFGALLFEQVSRTEYKRVAADSLTMVQFGKEVSLTNLTSNVRTIEVL